MDLSNVTESDLKELALQQLALQCKTDLFYLCKTILGYDLMTKRTHQELCDYTTSLLPNPPEVTIDAPKDSKGLSDQFDARKNFLLLLMPRGTFKSSVVTVGLTLQYLLNEPNGRVLIDSETYGKAKNFLAEVKGHLEDNEKYRAIFKAIHGVFPDDNRKNSSVRWTDTAVDVSCRTRKLKEPSISVCGIDRSINGMHYDLVIADDLHSEKNVTNADQIQQVIQHYKLLLSLLDPGRPLVIIGTRWDYNDLYQYILDFQRSRFNVLVRKAIMDDGSLFFPERLTQAYLDEQKESQGSYIFACQYMNEPVSDENAVFKRGDIVRKSWEEVRGRPINWYLSVDPSYEGAYSDYAAFVLAGMDYQRDLYVRYLVRKKMTYGDIINEIFRIYTDPSLKDLKIQKILVESVATQKSLGVELANEQRRRNTWLPIQEIRSRITSKEERVRGLAPFYEFGHIFHVQECPQLEDFEYELLHFPKGTHDDMVDALASILEIASPPKATSQARDDRPRRRVLYKPRSPITGV